MNRTDEILMIRPSGFGFNAETAETNTFQKQEADMDAQVVSAKAREEFDGMVEILRRAGVTVHVFEDTPHPVKPDAVFPNNWITFHRNGRIVTYPMLVPSRRCEIRPDILHHALSHWHFSHVWRMDVKAREGQILEGTGSMILDRPGKVVYAGLSSRTHEQLLDHWCAVTGYQSLTFKMSTADGHEIYHTNVMMALGQDYAVICLEAIQDVADRTRVETSLRTSGREIISIRFDQMDRFAGNMLEVAGKEGEPLLVMSEQARQSLDPEQVARLSRYARLIPVPLWTIEHYGGGSARCMMAEVFRPPAKD
ncbi:MAG: amidinotransferase [Saprospiraceae bacterium]|nr:amidinotransferase [Saprospiraceae bacterium]